MVEKLQQVAEKALTDSVVRLVWEKTDEETGEPLIWPRASGFFVGPNLIVTNIHCVAGAPSFFAEIVSTKTKFPVEGVVAFDAKNDLVIFKVTGEGVLLPLGDSDTVQIGDVVCAVGYPRGEKGEATQVTISSIQNLDKRLEIKEKFEQGYSGGAILNSTGKVMGVATATVMSILNSGGLVAPSYTIPARTLDRLLADVAEVVPLATWQKLPLIRAYAEIVQGQAKLGQGKHQEAAVCLDAALELNPDLVETYVNRAGLKIILGEAEAAIDDCNAALKRNPDLVMAYNNRAAAHLSLEHYREAIADCDIVLKFNSDFAQPYLCRAMAKIALEQAEAALADYDTALKLAPGSAEIYFSRANTKFTLKDYTGAIEDLDKVIDLNPELGSFLCIYDHRADAKRYLRDYEGAIEDYDKALQLDSKNYKAYNGRGIARYNLGRSKTDEGDEVSANQYFQAAIDDYTEAITLNANFAGYYSNRGHAKRYLGDYGAAIKDYDKFIQRNPKDETAYFDRGIAKYNLGKSKADQGDNVSANKYFQAAIDDYTEAITLDPKYATVYNSRGWIKYLLGQSDHEQGNREASKNLFQAAIADSDEAIRLSLDNPSAAAYHTRAAAKAALGAYREAIEDFNETILMKPDEARYYYDRGLAKQAFGQHEAAKTDFQKAKDLDPDVENKPF